MGHSRNIGKPQCSAVCRVCLHRIDFQYMCLQRGEFVQLLCPAYHRPLQQSLRRQSWLWRCKLSDKSVLTSVGTWHFPCEGIEYVSVGLWRQDYLQVNFQTPPLDRVTVFIPAVNYFYFKVLFSASMLPCCLDKVALFLFPLPVSCFLLSWLLPQHQATASAGLKTAAAMLHIWGLLY